MEDILKRLEEMGNQLDISHLPEEAQDILIRTYNFLLKRQKMQEENKNA